MKPIFSAPTGRSKLAELSSQLKSVENAEFIRAIINSVTDMVLILNENRQIVIANNRFLSTFGDDDPLRLLGLRPGEAVGCINRGKGPDGCGTSENCSVCEVAGLIGDSQEAEHQTAGACRIVISKGHLSALDLAVTATPLKVLDDNLTVFALKDIGHEKRRRVLEHVFFHDVLNTLGGVAGLSDLLLYDNSLTSEEEYGYKLQLVGISECLAEEIKRQRLLLVAESGEYIPEVKEIDLREAMLEVCKLYSNHVRTPNRKVHLENSPEYLLKTDRPLLRRVVGNMPRNIQLQVFQRSFSTKNVSGRGLGTYSMKLLGERYLGGIVDFRCDNGETTFHLKLPLKEMARKTDNHSG